MYTCVFASACIKHSEATESYPFIHYINCSFLLPIEKRLNSEPIRQIFNKTEVCLQALPQGGQTCILDSLSVGRIPSRLYLLCQVCKYLSRQSLNVPNPRVLVMHSNLGQPLQPGHHADIGSSCTSPIRAFW